MPSGELICARNGERYKWYLRSRDKSVYLPKKEKKLAQKLEQKKYYQFRREDLKRELLACRNYINMAEEKGSLAEEITGHAEYGKLLDRHCIVVKDEVKEWMNAEYERNTGYSENLIVKGTQGKMLRSKSEAIIDKILYPDFTIRHPLSGKFYYWEHFGMMDDAEYVNRACQKIKIYCDHGIIPSVNLILTYESKEHPLPIDHVEKLVEEYFL